MRKTTMYLVLTALFLCGGMCGDLGAQEKSGNVTSELKVPWDEFKRLVNLDEDEIVLSLETFEKLLEQTGVQTTPGHTVRDGNVVLTRSAFENLVNQMKPAPGLTVEPPFDFLVTKAIYSGKMYADNTAFTATFTVHVLKKGAYLRVPVLPQGFALEDIKVDGDQALVVSEGGYHAVVLSEPGEHTVTASFSLKSSLEKGPYRIDLSIQQTPITLLRLKMPVGDIDVEIPQAQQVVTSSEGNTTTVSAVITPGYSISVRWRKKVAVAEKIPPKLYCEVYHLVSIEDDALKTDSDINFNILHSEVDQVRFVVPDGVNVLSVTGEGVGEWMEVEQEGRRVIVVPFTYGKKGTVIVRVRSETPHAETGLANAFSGLEVLDTVRETGFLGIELNTSAEVVVAENEGLEIAAVQKLPPQLINKSAKPLILGFKYLKHPYSLVLDIKKHEKIAVPVATINAANVVTLFTEDGKVVHRLVYQVRNSAKQFLEIRIPDGADVWSVFVGDEPVESSLNSEGKLLVPLIRSRAIDNRLDTFSVEVIYCMVKDRFSWFGARESMLPAVDLLISQLIWSVYLPNDYSYHHFTSTLEKEEIIRGLNVFGTAHRQYDERAMKEVSEITIDAAEPYADELKQVYKGKDVGSTFRNIPMEEEQVVSQLNAELEFGGRLEGLRELPQSSVAGTGATGILPIHIQVPIGGQVYRFAKTIVKTEDPLDFRVVYSRSWVSGLAKWVIAVLILFVLFVILRRLTSGGRRGNEGSETPAEA